MKKLLALILSAIFVLMPLAVFADEAESGLFFEEAELALLNKYNAEIEAKIAEIENTPTEVVVTGTKYYVSSSTGNDKNNGLSEATAFKTIDKVNTLTLNPGDGVFFKRGDSFRIKDPLLAQSGVTYSAYGSGKKPQIVCSVDASGKDSWEKTEWENIYRYTGIVGGLNTNVGTIIFDGGRAWGVMVSAMLSGDRLDNGTVFNGLEHYKIDPCKFYGPQDLKGNLEFYHDMKNQALYLYCKDGNPGEVFSTIELADKGFGITVDQKTDVIIDNISIFGTGSHGIWCNDTKNITVQHCTFKWIGGSVQEEIGLFGRTYAVRFGNAVESVRDCDGMTMYHNYATQVYDCCWTAQTTGFDVTFKGVHIYENVAEFANTGSEVWCSDSSSIINMQVHDNYDRFIGYGWSHQRPSTSAPKDKDAGGWIGAGGFFYGQGNTGMYCEGNGVYNNVYFFAGSSSHSVGAVAPDKFNFHDNIYFMEEGKKLGSYMPFKGNYTAADIEVALKRANGGEAGTKFYYTKPEPFGDMYKLCLPKNGVKMFEDISAGFWGTDAIDYVVLNGLFNGTTATEFTPNGNMTRAMLVTVLSRLAKSSAKGISTYTDVNQNAWYAQGVYWAEKNDIVNKGGAFRPDANATREEMADMLYRYAKMLYKEGTLDGATDFADSPSITPAYADGIKFCTKNGIIGGYSDKTIKPKNNATRAEVATMIMRFMKYINNTESDSLKALENSDKVVLKGQDLKKMIDSSLVRGTVEEDTSIKFVPFAPKGSPRIRLLHAYNSTLDMFGYPVVAVKFDTNVTTDHIRLVLQEANNNGALIDTEFVAYARPDEKVIILDYSEYANELDLINYKKDAGIKLLAWGESETKEVANTDYFIIKEVVFFKDLVSAEAYAG